MSQSSGISVFLTNSSKGNLNRADRRRFARKRFRWNRERPTQSFFASKGSRAFFDKDERRLLGGAVSGACISNDVVATETLPRLGFRDDRQSFRHGTTAATRLTVAQVKPIGKIRSLVVTLRDTAAESARLRKNQAFSLSTRRVSPSTLRSLMFHDKIVKDRWFLLLRIIIYISSYNEYRLYISNRE